MVSSCSAGPGQLQPSALWRQPRGLQHLGAYLVVLTPVNVGPACEPSCVHHMGGLDLRRTLTISQSPGGKLHFAVILCESGNAHALDIGQDARPVLQPGGGVLKLQALLLEQVAQEAPNPAALAKHQEHLQLTAESAGSHCAR